METALITPQVIGAGLVGAIIWNTIAHHTGTPSSSSHALLGGLLGATLAHVGSAGVIDFPFTSGWWESIQTYGLGHTLMHGWSKIFVFLVGAPLIGAFL